MVVFLLRCRRTPSAWYVVAPRIGFSPLARDLLEGLPDAVEDLWNATYLDLVTLA